MDTMMMTWKHITITAMYLDSLYNAEIYKIIHEVATHYGLKQHPHDLPWNKCLLNLNHRVVTTDDMQAILSDSAIQEAYRSELAGLLGTVLLVEAIVSFFDLSNSACAITIACDSLSALLNSFDTSRPITVDKNHFNLLWAIRSKLEDSRITWHF
jgi:hypothetical protein